jgi:hypothetical protein
MKFKMKRPLQPSTGAEKLDGMKALKALSAPRRVRILNRLLTDSIPVGEIASH